MIFRSEQGDRRAGFGETVGIGEAGLREQLERALDQLQRHAAAAVSDRLQRRQIGPLTGIHARNDAREHRRHDEGVAHALGRGELQPDIGIEGRQQHDAAHRVDRAHQRGDAGDVIRRHADQRRFLRCRRRELHGAEDVRQQIGMTQQGRLRRRRRAAGEDLHGNAFAFALVAGRRVGSRLGVRDKLGTRAQHVRLVGVEAAHALDVADHAGRCDAAQQRCQIGVGEAVVQRHVRNAGERRTEQRDRRGLAALVEQRDMRAAAARQRLRRAARGARERAVRPAPAVADQPDAIGLGVGRHLQQKRNVHRCAVNQTTAAAWLP